MTDFVEARAYVAVEYPLRGVRAAQGEEALFNGVRWRTFFPEPIRVRVGSCFGDRVQRKEIERLHGAVPHRRDTQRSLFPVAFRNVQAPQGRGAVTTLAEHLYGGCFRRWR